MSNTAVDIGDSREFILTDKAFEFIRRFVKDHTGINLSDAKRQLVYGRLAKRLRQLGLNGFEEYCVLLQEDSADELANFVNAITTNLTAFFRENHHFEFLKETLFPQLLGKNQHKKRLRIWSAGCSTGEEPYSIAISVKEALVGHTGWDVKILATDLDSNVLATAQAGLYESRRVEGIPKTRLRRWFLKGKGENASNIRVSDTIREMISFKQLNLMSPWPMTGPFDVIFCRNVVIYFDKPTQKTLFNRYADILVEDGHLLIGHSESLFKVTDRFKLLGNTIYRRVG